MCDANELIVCDVCLLPANTYTHVNSGSLSRSWLDHCVASPVVHSAIADISVDYSSSASDHMPVTVTLNMKSLPRMEITQETHRKVINWNFKDEEKVRTFFDLVLSNLDVSDHHINHNSCIDKCESVEH